MKTIDEKTNVLQIIELDGQIEELEPIVAPGVATSPGPHPGVHLNHNETMVSDRSQKLGKIRRRPAI